MADKSTVTKTITWVATFDDGDTRTITTHNPNTAIDLVAASKRLSKFIKDNNALIGDKNGAPFTKFASAQIRNRRVTKLDI